MQEIVFSNICFFSRIQQIFLHSDVLARDIFDTYKRGDVFCFGTCNVARETKNPFMERPKTHLPVKTISTERWYTMT